MKTRFLAPLGAALLIMAIGGACSDSPEEPQACPAGTTSVTATVTRSGSNVVFDWVPRCPMALVLVEEDASDMWAVAVPGISENSTAAANVILPTVTYGQAPAGTEEDPPAQQLVTGSSYDLVLWMIVPPSAPCNIRIQNGCLMAVKTFVK